MDDDGFDLRRRWRVVLGWVCIGLGGLFILLGWLGVSGDPNVARQLPYLVSGGLGGLAFVVVGAGLLIAEDLRSDRHRLGRIEAALLDLRDLVASQAQDGEVKRSEASRRRSR